MIDITGYSMEHINLNGWYQSMYPDPQVQERARNRMDRMRQGDDLRSERWEITRVDGEKRLIAISTSVLIRKDGSAHVLGMIHDFTKEEHLQIQAALAKTDELTQINNRRGFKAEAELLFSLADRQKQPISCGFIDVDDFKTINDTLGHTEGDEVLKVIGRELNELTRSTDMVGRIGGDEFSFVLLGMPSAVAKQVSERLHQRLLGKMIDHGWKNGISMGVATFSTSIPDIENAMAYADRLMYQAKKTGKCKLIFEEVTGNSGS